MTENEQDQYPNKIKDGISNSIAAVRARPQMLALAQAFDELHPKAIEKLTPAEARQQPTIADAVNRLLIQQRRSTDPTDHFPGVSTREIEVEGATGKLSATVYTPALQNAVDDEGEGVDRTGLYIGVDGARPVILFFHGGGWVIADRKVYDGSARGLAMETGAVVVSVDYRQAPEHKFPAAWDDALAAYRWLIDNAASVGGDPNLLNIAGESAGGTLALATAIAARDQNLVRPLHVLCVYPVGQTSPYSISYLENAIAKPLNRAMVEWFVGNLTRTPEDLKDPRLSLVDANLAGLPPVTIINADIDPLRSDGSRLLDALEKHGNDTRRELVAGVTHEFFGAAAVLDAARDAQKSAAYRLRASWRVALHPERVVPSQA